MKVLQINSVINSGSTGRIAEEIGQELINIGHESYIAYGRNNANSNSVKIKIGTKWDIYLHGISSRIFDNHGLCSSNATKILIKDIQSVNPDIIHLHNLHGYYLNYQLLFKFLNEFNKPIVWTLHDCWSITGHCSHFDFIGCNKWKNECYECPELKQYPKSIFYDRSTRNYVLKKELFNSIDKLMLVPVSDWLRKKITTSFMASTNVKVINNGINTSIFKPVSSSKRKDLNIVNEVVLLGVASVWHERKGFKEFLKLSKIMPENYRIILVGVKKNQSKLLPQNIIGIERTESVEDLAEIYSIADVFVNPTFEDTFPTTNLEALACGTPVITYNTGGSVESIDTNVGIVVNKGDLKGILSSTKKLLSMDLTKLKESCREHAERLYKKEDRYKEYIDLYNKIIDNNV